MEAEDIIKNYFKEEHLKVLDNGHVYGCFNENYYAAVSLNYICEHVLNNKFNKNDIAKIIFKLCKINYLYPIPCTHANDLVFCKYSYQKHKYFVKFDIGKEKIINPHRFVRTFDIWVTNFNRFL